jgi:small-conductance mechanosensitive channel
MTQIETMKEKILAGEPVSPEMMASAQARDQIAEFESQRTKQQLNTERIERQRTRLEAARGRFKEIIADSERIESLRQELAVAAEKYAGAAADLNGDLVTINGVFNDAGNNPTKGLSLPFRYAADNNGSVTVDGKSLMPVRIDEEISHTIALAVGRQVRNHQPALGVPLEWIELKGEKR